MNFFSKYNIEAVTGIKCAVSSDMLTRIDLWNLISQGRAAWNENAKPCGIVETVTGTLANAVGEEVDVSSNNKELEAALKKLNENSIELIFNSIACGASIVRPIYTGNKLKYEIIKLGNYIPTSYDLDGTLTGAIITKKITEKEKEFLLLERHEFKNFIHSVNVELYKITGDTLKKTSLDACSITAGLTPSYRYGDESHPLKAPFIVEFRNREPNRIDGSNIPCALWQNTENLIEEADKQFARITWEQEGGEMRIFADEDLFKTIQTKRGERQEKRITGHLSKLIVKLSGNGTGEEKITTHAPALRTAQQVEAYNEILRRCELAWNIGKGTLSDLAGIEQTATQYTGGKKVLYSLVDSLESELEEKYKHVAYIFAYLLNVYEGVKFDDEIIIKYNDTARKDPEALRLAALQEVQNGIISAAEYRERIFGESAEVAAAKVPQEKAAADIGGFNFGI